MAIKRIYVIAIKRIYDKTCNISRLLTSKTQKKGKNKKIRLIKS